MIELDILRTIDDKMKKNKHRVQAKQNQQ